MSISSIIEVIHLSYLSTLNSFPRNPNETTNLLTAISTIDRNCSLIIFVSHRWIRGSETPSHPDTINNDKFQLCVEGAKKIKNTFAPDMKDCYLWIDYSCINQDQPMIGNIAEILKSAIQFSDCIFTPLYDPTDANSNLPSIIFTGLCEAYPSTAWNGNDGFSYLERAWCRIEMFYAANIMMEESCRERRKLLQHGLRVHHLRNRRPHFLYGTQESLQDLNPHILEPLDTNNSFFQKYNPIEGLTSKDADKAIIEQLVAALPRKESNLQFGYEGSLKNGIPHGLGSFQYHNGDEYSGDWYEGKREGKGILRKANGDEYIGEWEDDKFSGYGVYIHGDGSKYEGSHKENERHGNGKLSLSNGEEYNGNFRKGKFNGKGTYNYSNGERYSGNWVNGLKHGHGVYTYQDGSCYKGLYEYNVREGEAIYFTTSGDELHCAFKEDKLSPKLKIVTKEGEMFESPDGQPESLIQVPSSRTARQERKINR